MKSATLLVIFSLFIMSIYAAKIEPELPIASEKQIIPQAVDKKKTTTPAAITSTSTESTTPSTSTELISTTTQAPTTTAAPITSSTTTTTTTTTSPTPAPTTTTLAPKTTTVAPKPAEPKSAKYYVEENNITCILVEFAAQLNISYGNDHYILYNLPSNDKFVKADGKCGNETTEQNLIIIWWAENRDVNTLNLTFSLNTTSKPKEYSLTQAVFNLSSTVIPDNTERLVLYHVGNFFETRQSRSYHCGRAQTLNLTKNADLKSQAVGNVTISHVFMEAYRSTGDQKFSESLDCDAINTPDIVPIAVGVALIALVVVVLIAYLVGRRRAQSRGYVSM